MQIRTHEISVVTFTLLKKLKSIHDINFLLHIVVSYDVPVVTQCDVNDNGFPMAIFNYLDSIVKISPKLP